MALEVHVTGLVLLAALLHASWNTLLKTGSDRMLVLAWLSASHVAIALPLLLVLPAPLPESRGYILASILIHLGYKTFLLQAYRFGDLSLAYPLARGTSPLVVAALGGVLAGEILARGQALGVALISLGLFSLVLGAGLPRRHDLRAMGFAVATGLFIAAYTVVDGLGVRLSGNALAYSAWLFFGDGATYTTLALLLRRWRWAALREQMAVGLIGGACAYVAYALVIWALSLHAMAAVAALRETSVIFAALIGRLLLGEPFGRRRMLAAGLVAAGVIMLNLSR